MLCQECQQNHANVFITKIINGKKAEMHLCERCARQKEDFDFSFEPQFSLHNLFGSLLHDGMFGSRDSITAGKLQCPSCALTFAQFSQIGRMGCSECFSTFGEKLQPLLRRIHGSTTHTGKIPGRAGSAVKARRELAQMKAGLQQAVRREDFEEAARLRDCIRTMEQELAFTGEEKKNGGKS